jgi:hypothetical protein
MQADADYGIDHSVSVYENALLSTGDSTNLTRLGSVKEESTACEYRIAQ